MSEHRRRTTGEQSQFPYPPGESEQAFQQAFQRGAMPVAVYGLGKLGLPVAAVYADVCGAVIGADIDEERIETIAAGDCPIENEPGLDELVADLVASGALTVTTEAVEAADSACIHVIVVPTVLDGDKPKLSALTEVCTAIGTELAAGDLVLVESTVPPGTCTDQVVPLLAGQSDLDTESFGVAFCPERTASGRALQDIRGAYPKIVGGTDPESGRAAAWLYRELNSTGVYQVTDATTAEAVKLFEGVYRDVNIALANELAMHADALGIDVRAAIDAANTQPYCDIHDPGPGVGGHCIPYYPYFLFDRFDRPAPLLRAARDINEEMPTYTVQKLVEGLSVPLDQASVGVLGVTYRPGVKECRASPAIAIGGLLSELGAEVVGVDPLIDDWSELPFEPQSLETIHTAALDGLVLVTPHEAFDDLDWGRFAVDVVVDGRDAIDTTAVESPASQIHTLGVASDSDE